MKRSPDSLKEAAVFAAQKVSDAVAEDIVTCVIFIEKGTGLAALAHDGDKDQIYRALREIIDSEGMVIKARA